MESRPEAEQVADIYAHKGVGQKKKNWLYSISFLVPKKIKPRRAGQTGPLETRILFILRKKKYMNSSSVLYGTYTI